MLINRACELKGQFNIDCQLCVYRVMVRIIWEVRISEGQIIRAILYFTLILPYRDHAMTALSVVRTRRGTLKNATLTHLLGEVDDVLTQGLVVSTFVSKDHFKA